MFRKVSNTQKVLQKYNQTVLQILASPKFSLIITSGENAKSSVKTSQSEATVHAVLFKTSNFRIL